MDRKLCDKFQFLDLVFRELNTQNVCYFHGKFEQTKKKTIRMGFQGNLTIVGQFIVYNASNGNGNIYS